MTPDEALKEIQGLAGANRIQMTLHAAQRAAQRGAAREDVRSALVSATACVASDGKWKTTGPDLDGDELTCIVVIESNVIVVTLF